MKSEKIFSRERKVLAAGIAVVLLANAAGLTLYILEKRSGDRENTEYLERREFGQGDYEEKLTVKSEKGNQDITVQVREKEYGEEEAEEIIEQVKEEMDALIRGENKSLNKVQHPLYLPDRSPDFPVNLSWSTDAPEILEGVLLVQNLKKGNRGVLALLERESAAAIEERKRKAKICGEQASAKLLGPMFIQLALVMALVMIPAFLSFY